MYFFELPRTLDSARSVVHFGVAGHTHVPSDETLTESCLTETVHRPGHKRLPFISLSAFSHASWQSTRVPHHIHINNYKFINVK